MRTVSLSLLLTVSLLMALGITMLSSAVMLDSNFVPMVRAQAIYAALGFVLLCVLWRMDYRTVVDRHWWFYAASLLGLMLVLALGNPVNGARRWVFGCQPGEFAKLSLLLTLTAWCHRHADKFADGNRLRASIWGFVFPGLLVLPFLGLLYLQPDRGTLMLYGLVTVVVLLVAGMPPLCALLGLLLGAGLGAHFYGASQMVRNRVDAFLHPENYRETIGAQALKSLAALREGGLEGLGLGAGVIKHRIPEQHTDFIFPVIGEELGLFFTLGVLVAYVVILLCAMRIARRSDDPRGRLLAAGIGFLIAGQAAINIAVVTNSMPNKGMPLPFVSRGGSSIVAMLALVGVLLSIARLAPGRPAAQRAQRGNPFNDPGLETLPA